MNTLPILIAARNEEMCISNALCSFSRAAEVFCETTPGMRVVAIVCDNGSEDETRARVLSCAESLKSDVFEIILIEDEKPGKVNALRTAIEHLRSLNLNFPAVVFADADVEWVPETLVELWQYWDRVKGTAALVGGMIQRKRAGPENFFEIMESLFYVGYGKGFQGQGAFAAFVSGMTYVCNPLFLHVFQRIPVDMGNEDVALSYLVGRSRLHICPTAIVRYSLTDSWQMFLKVRGRHVRECHRLRNYVARRMYSRLHRSRRNPYVYALCYLRARRRVATIAETRTLPFLKGLLTNFNEIATPRQIFVVGVIMLPAHTYLKIRGCLELMSENTTPGWKPFRRGVILRVKTSH